MNEKKFIKIEEELLKQHGVNQEITDELDETLELLNEINLENRNLNSLWLTFAVHIVFLVLLFIMQQMLHLPSAIMNLLCYVTPICSSGIGIALELIQNNMKKQKLKILDLPYDMTNNETKEENVRYEIEKQKMVVRNNILDKALQSLRKYQEDLKKLLSYNKMEFGSNISNFSIEQLEEDIALYNAHFKEKYDRLDKLVTKKTIIEFFHLNKCIKKQILELLGASVFYGFVPLILYGSLSYLFNIQLNLPYLMPFSLFISLIYKLKNKKDEYNSLVNINNESKAELPLSVSESYVNNINKEIKEIIANISSKLSEFTEENILLEEKRLVKLEKENELLEKYLNTPETTVSDILLNSLVEVTIEENEGPKLVKKR